MTLRLAILGYGFIADLHARAARECGLTVAVVAGHQVDAVVHSIDEVHVPET